MRELARLTGESVAEAVEKAVDARLATMPRQKGRIDSVSLDRLLDRARRRRVIDPRRPEEIMGFNDRGSFD
jgi:antitoxin VapB